MRFLKRPQFWLICALLALFPFFQNMSPFGEYDLTEQAPKRPEGYVLDPAARWVPQRIVASTPEGVGQRILEHNLNPALKNLEGLTLSAWQGMQTSVFTFKDGQAQILGLESEDGEVPFQISLVSPEHMRFSLEGAVKFSCDMKKGEEGPRVGISKDLSSKMHLEMFHQTEGRRSQIQMQMDW